MKEKSEKELTRIRARVWYRRYHELYHLIVDNQGATPKEILKKVDQILDDCRGYGYEHISISAEESLNQVLDDHK